MAEVEMMMDTPEQAESDPDDWDAPAVVPPGSAPQAPPHVDSRVSERHWLCDRTKPSKRRRRPLVLYKARRTPPRTRKRLAPTL